MDPYTFYFIAKLKAFNTILLSMSGRNGDTRGNNFPYHSVSKVLLNLEGLSYRREKK